MSDDLVIKLRAEDGGVVAVTGQAARGLQSLGAAGGRTTQALAQTAQATGVTRFQMQQLNYTVSDVVAQLSTGTSPFQILLQQGPQVRDAFGGIGNALRAIGSLITPVGVAMTALGAATATVTAAVIAGWREQTKYRDTIALTGNAAGLTADGLARLSDSVARNSAQTVGASRDILLALAATGRTSSEVIQSQAQAAARIADLSGESAAKIASSFASQLDAPDKFARSLNQSYNFLNLATLKYIDTLVSQGRQADAARVTNEALVKALEGQRQELGDLERAYESATKWMSSFWSTLKGFGRDATTGDATAEAARQLQQLEQQLGRNTQLGRGEASIAGLGSQNDGLRRQIAAARQRLVDLNRRADIEETNAAARSANAATVRAAAREDTGAGRGRAADPVGAIRDARGQYAQDFLRSEKAAYQQLADEEARFVAGVQQRSQALSAFIDDQLNAQQRRDEQAAERATRDYQRRAEQGGAFGRQLQEQAAGIDAALLTDERARAVATLAIERAALSSRIEQLQLHGDERNALADAAAEYMAARERELTEQLKPTWQRRLEEWQDTTRQMRDTQNRVLDDFLTYSEGIFRRWVRTGKISAADLVGAIADEFAKLVFRQAFAGPLSSLLGSFLGAPSAGAGSIAGPGISLGGVSVPGRANGGPVRAGGMYLVGEQGPELLRLGASGGQVVSTRDMARAGAGGGVQVTIVNNSGAQVSTSESRGADGQLQLQVLVDQVDAALAGRMAGGYGALTGATARRFGLNAAAGAPVRSG